MTIPGPAPTVAPTPRPTKAAAVSEAAGDANPTRTFQQTGTTVALLAAIVLACGLAVIVLIRRYITRPIARLDTQLTEVLEGQRQALETGNEDQARTLIIEYREINYEASRNICKGVLETYGIEL